MTQTAVSAIASAGTAIYAGQQAKAAAEAEAAPYAEEQIAARTAAVQGDAARQRDMNRTLASIDALRLGWGPDLMSPTGEAIQRESIDNATADVTTIRTNANRRTRRLGFGADASLDRGEAAGGSAQTPIIGQFSSSRRLPGGSNPPSNSIVDPAERVRNIPPRPPEPA